MLNCLSLWFFWFPHQGSSSLLWGVLDPLPFKYSKVSPYSHQPNAFIPSIFESKLHFSLSFSEHLLFQICSFGLITSRVSFVFPQLASSQFFKSLLVSKLCLTLNIRPFYACFTSIMITSLFFALDFLSAGFKLGLVPWLVFKCWDMGGSENQSKVAQQGSWRFYQILECPSCFSW